MEIYNENLLKVDYESALFNEVLELRRRCYEREAAGGEDLCDAYSHHFGFMTNGKLVGALRVTCGSDGPLESEDHYPESLLRNHRDILCASSRMCVDPNIDLHAEIPIRLTRFAWNTVLPLGLRVDISKVRLKAIPFYMRKLGYAYLKGSSFDFQNWDVRCGLIACAATNTENTSPNLSGVFEGVSEPISLSQLGDEFDFTFSYRQFQNDVRFKRESKEQLK